MLMKLTTGALANCLIMLRSPLSHNYGLGKQFQQNVIFKLPVILTN